MQKRALNSSMTPSLFMKKNKKDTHPLKLRSFFHNLGSFSLKSCVKGGVLSLCLLSSFAQGTEKSFLGLEKGQWVGKFAQVIDQPENLQKIFLYPAPPALPLKAYKEKYKQWLAYERTFKREEGVSVHGWFYQREGKPLIVYYGGNNEDVSDQLWWLESLKNYAFLAVNYRGYGLSEGEAQEKALVEDALFILDEIQKKTQKKWSRIYLIGRSLGTGVAVQVAAARPVGKLILITPYDSIEAVAKEHFWLLPLKSYLKDTWPSFKYAPLIKAQTTLLVAGKDEVIPPSFAVNLARFFKTPPHYLVFKEAHHGNIMQDKSFDKALLEALQ